MRAGPLRSGADTARDLHPPLSPKLIATLGGAALIVLAIVLRLSLWSFQSGDFVVFFAPWHAFLEQQGAWRGLGLEFANYTPPYLSLLALSTLLPVDALPAVKLISLLGDLALVGAVVLLLRTLARVSIRRKALGVTLVVFGPTVVLNGALWGQVDAGYSAVLIAAVAFCAARRPWWAMAMFGLALALKLQAVFLAPLFLLLVLRGVLPVRALLAAPVAYVLAFLPALLAGRPPSILYSIYAGQAGTYQDMALFAPSVWQLLPNRPDVLSTPATLAAVVVVLVVLLALLLTPGSCTDLLRLALLFALLCPFLLPHMHDRYFFLADVLSLLYAAVHPSRWWIAVAVNLASLLSYMPFLFGVEPALPFPVVALIMGGALAGVLCDVFRPSSAVEPQSGVSSAR